MTFFIVIIIIVFCIVTAYRLYLNWNNDNILQTNTIYTVEDILHRTPIRVM